MAERQSVCNQHSGEVVEVVNVSKADIEYIVKQLNTASSRANEGMRMGTHLIKRLRHSKKLLLCALESDEEQVAVVQVETQKKSWWSGFFNLLK